MPRSRGLFPATYVNVNCKSRKSEIQDESRKAMPSSEDVQFATAIRIKDGITRRRGKNGRKGRNDGAENKRAADKNKGTP